MARKARAILQFIITPSSSSLLSNSVKLPPQPPEPCAPSPTSISTCNPTSIVLSKPQAFNRTCGALAKSFVGQIGLHAITHSQRFPNDSRKVAFSISFMTDDPIGLYPARKSWSTSVCLAACIAGQTPTKSIEELVPAPYHQYLPMFKKSSAQGLQPQQKYDLLVKLMPGAVVELM
ncbi:uncharacterized protein VP01_6072g1 [Puccinia sorghi]|uniref:Uncharacterized protein n=1 Tax=Puccinia sorghi TaxID=27349 RepID=A0A0L6UJA7_9BASI|nr:uncharacterized protein VP01_6072g1 [Puccinia sorghi]